MKTAIILNPESKNHNTGSSHPENAGRFEAIENKFHKEGVLLKTKQYSPKEVDLGILEKIHLKTQIESVKQLSESGGGYFDMDTPCSSSSWNSAILAAGAGCTLADAIHNNEVKNGFAVVRPPGHHAEKDRPMGFCLFNNIAVTAKYIQSLGYRKVCIVDWDVHHGNGTEHSFYEDPSVFFLSLHQYPFYPGSGNREDRGSGAGLGFNRNIPLPAGSTEADYLDSFEKVILPDINQFSPDFILISAGFDAHEKDPLGGMNLKSTSYGKFTKILNDLAKIHCNGRLISLLEGGYHYGALAESTFEHVSALMDA